MKAAERHALNLVKSLSSFLIRDSIISMDNNSQDQSAKIKNQNQVYGDTTTQSVQGDLVSSSVQNPVGTVQNQPAAQPTQAVSQKQDQAASGLGKEQEKIATAAVGEFVKPSETEPVISQEEKEFGVEKVSEYPKLSEEHTKIGVKPSGEGVPVSTVPSGMVQLPMTQVKAKSILKMHKKVSESILWLATLVLKQIKISNKK